MGGGEGVKEKYSTRKYMHAKTPRLADKTVVFPNMKFLK
jgi:hypothetical protein